MSVHGSELKCKYLIKVNPGQVNKPAVAGDRGTGGEGEKDRKVEWWRSREGREGYGGWKGKGGGQKSSGEEGEKGGEKRERAVGPKGWFLLPVFIS